MDDNDGIEMEIALPPPLTGSLHIDKETTLEFVEELRQMCCTLMEWTARQPDYRMCASSISYKWSLVKLTRLAHRVQATNSQREIAAARVIAKELALESEQIDTLLSCQNKMEHLH